MIRNDKHSTFYLRTHHFFLKSGKKTYKKKTDHRYILPASCTSHSPCFTIPSAFCRKSIWKTFESKRSTFDRAFQTRYQTLCHFVWRCVSRIRQNVDWWTSLNLGEEIFTSSPAGKKSFLIECFKKKIFFFLNNTRKKVIECKRIEWNRYSCVFGQK